MAIVHVPGRRPFSQNLVHVYKDGHLVRTAALRCPSLSEVCQAGLEEAKGGSGTWNTVGWLGPGVLVVPCWSLPAIQASASGVLASTGRGEGAVTVGIGYRWHPSVAVT